MKTIIITEDEKILADVVSDELREAGYNVLVAGTGQECFDLLKTTVPDLVILDIKLPDMSGLRVLEEVRRKSTVLPIVICTAYDSFKTDYEVWASKISDYIVKPVDLDELKEKIKKVLGE
ncbi:MAG: response regulator [Elusimicrobia bacterium]|nr:response regulator [Elusimicrobiota bacterium]